MTKTTKTKNGRKINTYVKSKSYSLSFSRPVKGVTLSVAGTNPFTNELNRVRLDGRAVAALRRMLAA
jgi:hypothetical protein